MKNVIDIWTQTPLLSESCVFRTSRSLLNCYRVAQFVLCCSVYAMLLICAVLLSLCNICAQETLSDGLWPSLGNKLIKSNFLEKKNRWPGSWHSCSYMLWNTYEKLLILVKRVNIFQFVWINYFFFGLIS